MIPSDRIREAYGKESKPEKLCVVCGASISSRSLP